MRMLSHTEWRVKYRHTGSMIWYESTKTSSFPLHILKSPPISFIFFLRHCMALETPSSCTLPSCCRYKGMTGSSISSAAKRRQGWSVVLKQLSVNNIRLFILSDNLPLAYDCCGRVRLDNELPVTNIRMSANTISAVLCAILYTKSTKNLTAQWWRRIEVTTTRVLFTSTMQSESWIT